MKKTILIIFLLMVSSAAAVELYTIDFDKNSEINLDDLLLQTSDFGKSADFNQEYDINQDGKVSIFDLVTVAKNIGKSYTTTCGDGNIVGSEECDDGNTVTEKCEYGVQSCQVCSADCKLIAGETSFCGDGIITNEEECDDANSVIEDGCDNDCVVEFGFVCEGEPSSCQEKKLPKPITGTFLLLDFTYNDVEGWRSYFQEMKDADIDTVILIASGVVSRENEDTCSGSYVEKSLFDVPYQDWGLSESPMALALQAAYHEDFDVYIGLGQGSGCVHPYVQQDKEQIISASKQFVQEVIEFYNEKGWSWNENVEGLYINQELDVRKFTGPLEWKDYFQFYVDISSEIKATYPDKEIMLSPYMFEDTNYDRIYTNILYAIEKTDIDIYAPQDSVGTQKVTSFESDKMHFKALRDAVNQGNAQYGKNVKAWANVETFKTEICDPDASFSPPDIKTISWQIRAVEEKVDKKITWIYQWSLATNDLLKNQFNYDGCSDEREKFRTEYMNTPLIITAFQWYTPSQFVIKAYNMGNSGDEITIYLNYKTTDNQDNTYQTTTTIYDINRPYLEARFPMSEIPNFDWSRKFEVGVKNRRGVIGYYISENPETASEPSFT